jgi:predicted nucleic acid-binding protein
MSRVLADTSIWIAYFNGRDAHHQQASMLLERLEQRPVISNYIFSETVTFCAYRLGHAVASRAGTLLLDPDVTQLIRLTSQDERAAWELFLKRPDKTYSFADCASFVLMRRLGIQQAATLDADFAREGFEVLPGEP